MVNVPPDATEREIVLFFKKSGTIERVLFDFDVMEPRNDVDDSEDEGEPDEPLKEPQGEETQGEQLKGRLRRQKDKKEIPTLIPLPSKPLRRLRKTGFTAHVVFLDSSSLDLALASISKPYSWPISSEETSGLSHYQSLYDSLRPPLDYVKAHSDSSIELYEYELAKKETKIEVSKKVKPLSTMKVLRSLLEVVLMVRHWAGALVWRVNGSNDQERLREIEIRKRRRRKV